MPSRRTVTCKLVVLFRLSMNCCGSDRLVSAVPLIDVTTSVGRNPAEVLRVLDALQTDELCPCNWQKGDKTLNAA